MKLEPQNRKEWSGERATACRGMMDCRLLLLSLLPIIMMTVMNTYIKQRVPNPELRGNLVFPVG